jgi:hypothetical protein
LDYIQAGMTTAFKTDKPFWLPIGGALAIGMGMMELFSYINIFHYLYKHNQTINILPEETKKYRNKVNAETMVGQFYLFITDAIYIFFLLATFAPGYALPPETKDLITLLKNAEFGLMSVAHCMLIPQLRTKIFNRIKRFSNAILIKKEHLNSFITQSCKKMS